MPGRTPLNTLLSWAWVAHTIEIDNAFEAVSADRVGRCVRISLPMWTNGLRHIDEDGVTVEELHYRSGANCNIGGLERWGWISVGDRDPRRREGYGSHRGVTGDTLLRPTPAGRYARRAWPKVVAGIESRWRSRFGAEVIDALRAALLDRRVHASRLPWSPPEVNPTNGFRTQVTPAGNVAEGPVHAGTVAGELPLAALLGQTLTASTLEHERESEVSLPLSANVLRIVGSEMVRVRDLPGLSGISKEALAMAVSYLRRDGRATMTPERGLSLTPGGLDALDGYQHLSSQTAGHGLRAPLEALLARTDALTAGLAPPHGCWRAQNPYLAQTRRLLADPTGALPWQPMVLHRAGWPDGS